MHEKLTALKTLFVKRYLERKDILDDELWNEQIKVSIQNEEGLKHISSVIEKKKERVLIYQ